MKVNMTPNPLDVVTIHASQGDTEARQWEFELHNNGELIDTSEITEQMVFKSYKGGTEQILPENTSTPTTSPFKGDIKYPQGLLSDQEFLYRESPTEEDGLAKITDIKGNTLNWNQLVQNGNFASTSGWNFNNPSSASVSSNTLTVSANADATLGFPLSRSMASTQGHKYLIMCDVRCSQANQVRVRYPFVSTAKPISANTWARFAEIGTATEGQTLVGIQENSINGATYDYKNFVCFDLTQMGLDSITDPSDFTSLFPLPYYAYNQGTLLSFNGNGIKTVGKNILNINNYRSMDSAWTLTDGVLESNNNSYKNYVSETIVGTGNTYTLSFKYNVSQNRMYAVQIYNRTDNAQLRRFEFQSALTSYSISDVLENGKEYDIRVFGYSATSGTIKLYDVQFELGSTATDFEPYTSSTLSLPISTYFPTGMKSAGGVYDELTETKAITRIGAVDLGSLEWVYDSTYNRFNTTLTSMKLSSSPRTNPNLLCPIYETISDGRSVTNVPNMAIYQGSNYDLSVHNTSYTDATVFKTAMSGIYLYYELKTSTETSFTTASLVTENAEIPLSNDDGVLIGKCTEQLSSESGFFDAKIKLADEDGECYSNKIQLHVERSPQ